MNHNSLDLLNRMIAVFPGLAESYQETVNNWLPEDPPVTIAFGEIGEKLVEDFDVLSPGVRQTLFRLIEEGMASTDEELGTAVATGLIEAMIAQASVLNRSWEIFRAELGPHSKTYADAWLAA